MKEPLDVRKMRKAARLLVGTHDFARFSGPLEDGRVSTTRHMYEAAVHTAGEIVTFDFVGSSFLPRQVRFMAGSLVDTGRGRVTLAEFRQMIGGRDGRAAASVLPPQGLCLMEVTYAHFPPEVGESDDAEH